LGLLEFISYDFLISATSSTQTGVLLTLFSNWGTENSLEEKNLEITEGNKSVTFWGSKIDKHSRLCGRAPYRATKKSRGQNAAGKTTIFGMFKDSAIILDVILQPY
jgi:hypothetical protein